MECRGRVAYHGYKEQKKGKGLKVNCTQNYERCSQRLETLASGRDEKSCPPSNSYAFCLERARVIVQMPLNLLKILNLTLKCIAILNRTTADYEIFTFLRLQQQIMAKLKFYFPSYGNFTRKIKINL